MKRIQKSITKALLLILFCGAPVLAQQQDGQKAARLINALERKIEQVARMAQRYNNEVAMALVENAKEKMAEAREQLQNDPPRYFRARQLLAEANALADRAARLLLIKPAAQAKRELERIIQKLEQVSGQSSNSELFYFLNKARAFEQQAERAFEEKRYLRGHDLLKVALHFAEKGLSLLEDRGDSFSGRRMEQYLGGIAALFGRAEALVDDDEQARRLLNESFEYLQQARALYENDRMQQALSMMLIAERLLYRVIDMAQNSGLSMRQQLENNLQSLSRYAQTLEVDVADNSQAAGLLQKARQLLGKARQNLDANNLGQARINMELARKVADKAFQLARRRDGSADAVALRKQLEDLQRFINLQRNELEGTADRSLLALHEEALAFYNKAESELDENPRRSSLYMSLGLQLLNHLENLRKRGGSMELNTAQIEDERLRLTAIITRLNQNSALNEMQQLRLQSANDMLEKGRRASANQNWLLASEMNRLVRAQVERIVQ